MALSQGSLSTQSHNTDAAQPKRLWEAPVLILETVAGETLGGKQGQATETHIGCVANCVGPAS